MTLEEVVASSGVFLVLATENWLDDVNRAQSFVMRQYTEMKKHLDRPVLLVWNEIEEPQRERIRREFKAFDTVQEMEFKDFATEGARILKALTERSSDLHLAG